MKTKSKILPILLFCLATSTAFSQQKNDGRKAIFANYPGTISLSRNTLSDALATAPGQTVSINFSENFVYTGTVLSNVAKYSNLQTVIIKSPAFGNALLQLSKIINDDKSIHFTGRILSTDASDGYEIKKDAAGNYSFQKFETAKILQDCSF